MLTKKPQSFITFNARKAHHESNVSAARAQRCSWMINFLLHDDDANHEWKGDQIARPSIDLNSMFSSLRQKKINYDNEMSSECVRVDGNHEILHLTMNRNMKLFH